MSTIKELKVEKQIYESEKNASDAILKEDVKCFDCGCDIVLNGDDIENGSLLSYKEDGNIFFVFKCDSCLAKSKEIANYKECEIYTRIVGYLRPVKQYNLGKQQEYKERTEYKIES